MKVVRFGLVNHDGVSQRLSTTIHRSFDYGYMYPDQRLRRPIEHVLETLPDEGLVVTLRRISVGFMKGFLG